MQYYEEENDQQEFTFIDSLQKFYNDVIQKSDPVFTEKDIKIKWANFNFKILQGTAYPKKHWDYLTDEEKNILFCLTRNEGNPPWIDAYKKSKEMLSLLNTQPCNEKEKENIRNLIAAEQTYKASTESRVIGPVLILKMDNLSEDDSEIDLITKIIKNHAEYFNVTSHEISNYEIDVESCRRLVNAFITSNQVPNTIKNKLTKIEKEFGHPRNIKTIQNIIFDCHMEKILNNIPINSQEIATHLLKSISPTEDLGAIIQKIEKKKNKNDSLLLALIINKKKHGFIIENWKQLQNVTTSLENKIKDLATQGEHEQLQALINNVIPESKEDDCNPYAKHISNIISTLEKINPRTESLYHNLLIKILNSDISIRYKTRMCYAITQGRNEAIKKNQWNLFNNSEPYKKFSEELKGLNNRTHVVLKSPNPSTDRSQNNSRAFSTTDPRSNIPRKKIGENTSLTGEQSELDVPVYGDSEQETTSNPNEEKSWWSKLNFLTSFWVFFNNLFFPSDKKTANNYESISMKNENVNPVKSWSDKFFSFFSAKNNSAPPTEECSTVENSLNSSLNSN